VISNQCKGGKRKGMIHKRGKIEGKREEKEKRGKKPNYIIAF
jgi:hypothetical protein